MGIQDQVTELGQEPASFHNNWLLTLCVVISLFVLALLVWTIVTLPPRRQPDAVADQPQHADRGGLDPGSRC